jgi:anion transporter
MIKKISSLPQEFKQLILFVLAVVAAGVVLVLPLNIVPKEQHILAVVIFMLVLFMTQAVPLAITGLMGSFAFWFLCGERFPNAFSGFVNSTPWFILAALLFGNMAVKSGIPDYFARFVLDRVGKNYGTILAGMIVLNFVLTAFIPAGAAKVVVLCTIALGIINTAGIDIKSNVSRGMILVLTYTATIFDKTIIAGAASILSRGIIENYTGISISWGKWFIAYAPTDIITMVFCWYLVMKLFPPEPEMLKKLQETSWEHEKTPAGEGKPASPLSFKQKYTIALLVGAIVLWSTDTFHGVNPAVIGLGVALAAFIPGVGILDEKDFRTANFSLIIFVACALTMGNLLVNTEVLSRIAAFVFSWVEPIIPHEHILAACLYAAANFFHLFLGNEPALLSASLPLVLEFAKAHSLNPEAIGMIWVFAAGGKLFIYQSGVLAVGYAFGAFTTRDLLKLGAALIIVEGLNIAFITPLYWNLMGLTIH